MTSRPGPRHAYTVFQSQFGAEVINNLLMRVEAQAARDGVHYSVQGEVNHSYTLYRASDVARL